MIRLSNLAVTLSKPRYLSLVNLNTLFNATTTALDEKMRSETKETIPTVVEYNYKQSENKKTLKKLENPNKT